MSLALRRADFFSADFDAQFCWYLEKASEAVAERTLVAVAQTLEALAANPGMGRSRRFRHPELQGIRSYRVRPPFDAHLVFYRGTEAEVLLVRLMHGRRDLPRRLVEPPGRPGRD